MKSHSAQLTKLSKGLREGVQGSPQHCRQAHSTWCSGEAPLTGEITVTRVCVPGCFHHLQLCDPMACSPPGSSVRGILQERILGCHALLPGIFLTRGPKPRLLRRFHWQAGSLPLVLPGKPRGQGTLPEISWRQRCSPSANSGAHSPTTVQIPSLGLLVDPQNHWLVSWN